MLENERVKEIRKAKGMTLEQFGSMIGIQKSAISKIERGENAVSDQTRLSICRAFNVNETWLRTGEGEMFLAAPTSELDALAARYPNMTHETYVLVEKLINLPKASQDIITGFLREVVNGFGDVAPGTPAKPLQEMTDTELHIELDRQLTEEKEAADESSVSGCGNSGTATG